MFNTDTLISELKNRAAQTDRLIVAVAGPPGAGKSTLAAHLAEPFGADAAVLPMDGYHLDNTTLRQLGLLDRKGAPDTFSAETFVNTVQALREATALSYPTFDRASDKTVPDGGRIEASTKIILVEGNYLLLNRAPWTRISELVDLTVFLEVPRVELMRRLVARWRDHGLSEAEATARALGNDMRNADLVINNCKTPDFTIRQKQSSVAA